MATDNKLSRSFAASLIPAHKRNNVDAIIAFLLCEDGSVRLTAEQQELLDRADFADTQLRQRTLKKSAIVTLISNKYKVATSTAWKDIERAGSIFGSTRLPNRQYLLSMHIERIEDSIALHERQGKSNVLPKLYEAYTRAIAQLPDGQDKKVQATAVIFNFFGGTGNELVQDDSSDEEAEALIRAKLEARGTYVDYEDVDEKEGDDE